MGNDEAIDVAQRFLEACTAARWDDAAPFVAPTASFVFPTGRYDSLEGVAAGRHGRYEHLVKRFMSFDVSPCPDGLVVVGVAGHLEGVNVHGVPFSGVRFFDRLVLDERGLVIEQQVYNDLAGAGVLARTSAPGL